MKAYQIPIQDIKQETEQALSLTLGIPHELKTEFPYQAGEYLTVEASINGEWLLMNYDYKTNMIWADRLDSTKPLQGELVIKVVDNAGNENVYHQMIP